jgi:hypothetical protein
MSSETLDGHGAWKGEVRIHPALGGFRSDLRREQGFLSACDVEGEHGRCGAHIMRSAVLARPRNVLHLSRQSNGELPICHSPTLESKQPLY